MRVLIFGKNEPVQKDIIAHLKAAEHQVIRANNRNKIPDGVFDICVDTSTHSASVLRLGLNNLKDKVSHYILLSSHRVYPELPREVPWAPGDITLSDESGFSDLHGDIRIRRAVERELRLLSSNIFPWTILRPGIIETSLTPDRKHIQWYVQRILDGGPIILPDSEEPLFRHISSEDLTRAIITVAEQEKAYSRTIHVVDQGILTFSSYAELIMRGLGQKVPIKRVPSIQWESAGLETPMGEHLHSSFIDDSRLLRQLGWEPTDEAKWVHDCAKKLATNPRVSLPGRSAELALLDLPEDLSAEEPGQDNNLCFVGEPGNAASFRLAKQLPSENNSTCLLKTLSFTMGTADEQYLLNHSPDNLTRVLGRNALLKVVDSGDYDLPEDKLYIPVAQHPCGNEKCNHCKERPSEITGIDEDGFAQTFVSLPPEHLLPVPGNIDNLALLADPLACLMSILPGLLEESDGQVWIYGHRVEAALANLILKDAGYQPPISIYRTNISPTMYFRENQSLPVQKARDQIKTGTIQSPAVIVNASGSRDGDNLLSKCLQNNGVLISPYVKTSIQGDVLHAQLPLTAPAPYWLEKALEQLDDWRTQYDLDVLLQRVDIDTYWDIFLPEYFSQPYIQLSGGTA